MRSELVFGATTYAPNRYLLTRLAAEATRRFHRPNIRIEDTTNEVLHHFSRANPIAGGQGLLASAQMTREPWAGLCDLDAAKTGVRSAKTGVSTSQRDFEIGKAELLAADAKRNARMRSLVAFG